MKVMEFLKISVTVLLFCTALLRPYELHSAQDSKQPSIIKAGFSTRIFPDVDQRDMKIALDIWTREIARNITGDYELKSEFYSNLGYLQAAVRRGELTLIVLPVLDYLKIRDTLPMTPVVTASIDAAGKRKYVLITRKDSGLKSVSDLRNRSIMLPASARNESSLLWLDVQLQRTGNRNRKVFFRQIKDYATASQGIMAVFFKQSDAALVRLSALETAISLNPQIGRQVNVISESKSLHGDVTCIADQVDDKLRSSIVDAALKLHESATGKQLMTMFQVEKAVPFNPKYLDGVLELVRERDRLSAIRR
jgi:ABC-type phosphate/phosphonate transport system substrate-binding protein